METENTTQDYIDLAENAPASIGAAYAAIAQAKTLAEIAQHLATMNQHLANIANGLAAIHLYGAGHGPTPPSPEERATFWQED